MAYTPTEWKNGDVITAEKLNKLEDGINSIDIGYETINTEKTILSGRFSFGRGNYNDLISDTLDYDYICIELDSQSYVLPRVSNGTGNYYIKYGDWNNTTPDYTIYPIAICRSQWQSYDQYTINIYTDAFRGDFNLKDTKIYYLEKTVVVNNDFTLAVKEAENDVSRNIKDGSAEGSVRGVNTKTNIGKNAFAEGKDTTANGEASHAEGRGTTASGDKSHAEGGGTTASGSMSHAEGSGTTASGQNSHAEGSYTKASGANSHAEGDASKSSGSYSHAQNNYTIAQGYAQTTIGQYNIAQGTSDKKVNTDYAFIIGNGTSDNQRSNAFAIKWDGTFVFANGTEITPVQFAQLLALLN